MMKAGLLLLGLVALGSGQLMPHEVLPVNLENEARYQLLMAYGAYCPKANISTWTCKWCKQLGSAKVYGVANHEGKDGQVFVARDNQSQIIVAFRGSHNVENWVEDFDFFKVHLTWEGAPADVEVHKGFLESYEVLRGEVRTWVAQAQTECPECTLHITGHSLGAALATLCVTDFRLQGVDPYMWNFGDPRVGNKAFADMFIKMTSQTHPVYRMVNEKDLVPHLPLQDQGFHHVAREVWRMPGNQTYMMCDNSGEDPRCSDSVKFPDIKDHLTYMGIKEDC